MFDTLVQATGLPNLHPAVVHFPIALLLLATATDAVFLLRRRWRWLEGTAALLYITGALGALAAFLTGRQAADAMGPLSVPVQQLVNSHADWAERTLWLFAILALARAVLAMRDRRSAAATWLPVRIGVLVVAIAGAAVLAQTADRGGSLVYGHGVAVTRSAAEGVGSDLPSEVSSAGPLPSESSRLVQRKGLTRWTPRADDDFPDAVEVLRAEGPPSVLPAVDGVVGEEGLLLEADGKSLILLPGEMGDVQVEAELVLENFEGALGVIHHATDFNRYEGFVLSQEGSRLVVRNVEGSTALDRSDRSLPVGRTAIGVSAVGGHYKGILGGETVVHGHRHASGETGRTGLLVDGRGRLRLLSLQARSATEGE